MQYPLLLYVDDLRELKIFARKESYGYYLPIPEAPPVTRAERPGLSSIFVVDVIGDGSNSRAREREKQRGRDEISTDFFLFLLFLRRGRGF